MHGSGMMQSVRNNLKQLNSHFRKKTKIQSSAKPEKIEYNFGKPTEKELEIIKQNIRSRAKTERLRVLTVTLIVSIIIFTILYFYFSSIKPSDLPRFR